MTVERFVTEPRHGCRTALVDTVTGLTLRLFSESAEAAAYAGTANEHLDDFEEFLAEEMAKRGLS